MATHSTRIQQRAALIIQCVLFGMAFISRADAVEPASGDEAVRELTQRTSEVEVGVGDVTQGSYKFGEYNGLQDEGAFAIFNFDLNGGAPYNSNSVERWSVRGSDLGIDTRQLDVDYVSQGRFRIDLGYDQLRHNISDSYQTPFLGAGTDTQVLPAGWLKPIVPQVNPKNLNDRALSPVTGLASAVTSTGQVAPPTAAQSAAVNATISADVPAFYHYDLYTNRYRWNAGFAVNLSRHWQFSAAVRQERKDGSQPLGAVSSGVQENSVILAEPIDTLTEQYDAGFHYASSRGSLDIGYYGSIFHNDVKSITWTDVPDPTQTPSMSSAPSNQFHQLNLAGGYSFTPDTRLAIAGSYGRSTQDDAFLSDASLPLGLPVTSLDALIVSTALDVKLTSRPTRRVNVAAEYRFDDQDNRTDVHGFIFYDANLQPGPTASAFNAPLGLPPGTLSSNVNIFSNRPHSRRLNQADLNVDYALLPGHNVAIGYRWQGVQRHCHDTWIDCENAATSDESTVRAEWRATWLDELSTRVAYAYSNRSVDYNPNAWLALVPMANLIPGAPVAGATTSVYGYLTQTGLTGWGPPAGFPATPNTGDAGIFSPNNNIVPQSLYGSRDNVSELPGLRRFDMADRRRDKLRGALDWQATERLSLQAEGEWNRDDYPHSTYGLLRSESYALHLEGSYAINEDFELPVFYSHEDLRSSIAGDGFGTNTNAAFVGQPGNTLVSGGCYATVLEKNEHGKVDPCLNWFTDMRERADTFGLTLARNNLVGGKLRLAGDLVGTVAHTNISVRGGSYANNPFALAGAPPLPPGVPAVFFIPATDLPPVSTRMLEIRLRAQYSLSRASQLNFLATFARLKSSDFAYDGMQFGTGTEQLPTLEHSYDYSTVVFGISYVHRFY